MAKNRGKQFEEKVREAFEKVPDVSVVRLHDQTTGFLGSSNHCDFIVYKKPYEYHIECKSVHGNTLSIHSKDPSKKYGNITNKQWEGLLEKSKIKGVKAGVLCWWVDRDVTLFIDIRLLEELRKIDYKSIDYCASFALEDIDNLSDMWTWIIGKKKRVFFDYDMKQFFKEAEHEI